ncbi:MAG: GNAT family N-acetyltransferase [Anaerolineae bacterium]|nr:GNAT family N-acetyltransferase [Anaerolineae bacterium]MDW8171252.1 GNAT family N-acetyltransferase [Anaerolineae bacterium]
MSLSIRPYARLDYEAALDLLYESRRTHQHLDWYRVGRWLEIYPQHVFTAWQGERLLGLMSFSEPLHGSTWLRLLALADRATEDVLGLLWQAWRTRLRVAGVRQVGVMVVYGWLAPYLPALGFHYSEDIVTFFRPFGSDLPFRVNGRVQIESAYLQHLGEMTVLDHTAFQPPWQMSADEIRQAQRQAASCTLALLDGRIVGYQITTRHQDHAHLARLAVDPSMQGRGIGAALLYHLLSGLERRHVRSVSVNTQMSNVNSQKLYVRCGFSRNGYDLPVWLQTLDDEERDS